MSWRRLGRAGALGAAALAIAALALAGCASPTAKVLGGSAVTVAFDEPFVSLNPVSEPVQTESDRELASAALAGFSRVGASGKPVADHSFGSITVLSRDPLTVRYTVADGVRWSDGTEVDAVDLLLAWAAESGDFPAFRAHRSFFGLRLAPALPAMSEDRKSLTVAFDAPGADYESVFGSVLPAHVAVRESIGATSPEAAKDALIDAVRHALDGDSSALDRIAAFWNDGFVLGAGADVLLSDGPYRIASADAGTVTLVPNADYAGSHAPTYATVRLVTLDAASALQGIEADQVQLASFSSSTTTAKAIVATDPSVLSDANAARVVVSGHGVVLGVDPAPDGTSLLWNLWAWQPGH